MKKPSNDANKGTNNKETLKIDTFGVARPHVFKNGNVGFDLTLNGITIYGCIVVESEKGDFISLPQRQGSDGKYYSIVWARISEADQKAIIAEVEKLLNN